MNRVVIDVVKPCTTTLGSTEKLLKSLDRVSALKEMATHTPFEHNDSSLERVKYRPAVR